MSPVNWKTNFAVIWFSQLLSIAGFPFALPFGPYYIQELRVHDPSRIEFWVAFFGAAPPLSLSIFSPFWGMLADRFGWSIYVFPRAGACISVCRSRPIRHDVLRRRAGPSLSKLVGQRDAAGKTRRRFRLVRHGALGGLVQRTADEWAGGSGIRDSRHLFCRSLPVYPAAAAHVLGCKATGSRCQPLSG